MIFPFKHSLESSNLIPKSILEIRYFDNLHAHSVFWFSSNFPSILWIEYSDSSSGGSCSSSGGSGSSIRSMQILPFWSYPLSFPEFSKLLYTWRTLTNFNIPLNILWKARLGILWNALRLLGNLSSNMHTFLNNIYCVQTMNEFLAHSPCPEDFGEVDIPKHINTGSFNKVKQNRSLKISIGHVLGNERLRREGWLPSIDFWLLKKALKLRTSSDPKLTRLSVPYKISYTLGITYTPCQWLGGIVSTLKTLLYDFWILSYLTNYNWKLFGCQGGVK